MCANGFEKKTFDVLLITQLSPEVRNRAARAALILRRILHPLDHRLLLEELPHSLLERATSVAVAFFQQSTVDASVPPGLTTAQLAGAMQLTLCAALSAAESYYSLVPKGPSYMNMEWQGVHVKLWR